MAKQFKLNIKNTQLAQAINLGEVKKKLSPKKAGAKTEEPAAKKEELVQEIPVVEKEEVKEVEAVVEEAAPKMKARSKSVFSEPKAEAVEAEKPPVEEAITEQAATVLEEAPQAAPPPVEEQKRVSTFQLPKKASPEGLKKLQAMQKERLGPTGRHIKDIIPPPPPPKKEVPRAGAPKAAGVEEKKEEKKPRVAPKTALEEEEEKKKGAKVKEFRDLKPPKKQKAQAFDARDKQGLRGDEEGAAWRKRRAPKMKFRMEEVPIVRPTSLKVRLPITIKDLAQEMKLKSSELIGKLFGQGVLVTLNDFLDDETTVQLLGEEFGCTITIDTSEAEKIRVTDKSIKEEITSTPEEQKMIRPPVVAFMGHVDHGKTSLIDTIRKSNRVSFEAGAITQHIGAFKCHTAVGDITVLDTPGHEAFSAMRARGADVTDIVVLVVAGDEGFQKQTDEALQHAQAAGVTIVVAINKCDKPNFNAELVYRQLADHNLLPEAWGGQTITVNTSAVSGQGIKELLEMLALQAEVLELKANPAMRARGTVLESEMHKGMGAQSTVLVLNGTLRRGDNLVFGSFYGRVKTMKDEFGNDIIEAPPSTPVSITGLSGLPRAGDEFIAVATEKDAKEIAEKRAFDLKTSQQAKALRSIESILQKSQEGAKKILNVILRADVQGSLEALKTALGKIVSDKVDLNIIFTGIGEITESDVQLAAASKAVIIGFHNSIESNAEQIAKELGVETKMYDVIYHAIDAVKELMAGTLDKIAKEEERGKAEVLRVFKSSQVGAIAGCMVTDGAIVRNYQVRLVRNKQPIWKGTISSLKRLKEDVREVKQGFECGIVLNNAPEVEPGDIIEAYETIYIKQVL